VIHDKKCGGNSNRSSAIVQIFALCSANGFVQIQALLQAIQQALDIHPEIQASVNSRLAADYQLKAAKGGYLPRVDPLGGYGCAGPLGNLPITTPSCLPRIKNCSVSTERILLDSENELFNASRCLAQIKNIQLFTQYRIKATMSELLKSQGVVAPQACVVPIDVKSQVQLPGMN
jgi:hypothetical protein